MAAAPRVDYKAMMRKYAKQEAEQFALLKKQPLQTLTGVLTPSGLGGGQTNGRPWMLIAFVLAWRLDDGPVTKRELRLLGPMAERATTKLMNSVKDYAIVRMQVRMPPADRPKPAKGDPKPPDGLIVKWQGVTRDSELAAIATKLAKPVTTKDKTTGGFGKLTFNRGLKSFDGKAKWGKSGPKVSISFYVESESLPEKAAAAARKMLASTARWEARARKAAVAKFYKLWMKTWREDRPLLTKAQFASKLTVDTLTFEADGAPTIWLDDHGLFYDHHIMVVFTARGAVKDLDLIG